MTYDFLEVSGCRDDLFWDLFYLLRDDLMLNLFIFKYLIIFDFEDVFVIDDFIFFHQI